ncbi:ASCH domain-containing protein [Paraburkholderia sp. 35.1]|uniref:ASCH domain-containing protein n=1 Tax=Paraburkholderia sp. 35.1 TaxID=2991058 RepID=UPI003D1F35F6
MRALSIRQPWAWLIVRPDLTGLARAAARAADILKDIENRSWPTKVRGRVLIHASKGMTRAEYEAAQDPLWPVGGPTIELPSFEHLQRGGIIGVATIDACIQPANRSSLWHFGGSYEFHLVDARPLPFVECKGALGFFDVPHDVAAQLRQMVLGVNR